MSTQVHLLSRARACSRPDAVRDHNPAASKPGPYQRRGRNRSPSSFSFSRSGENEYDCENENDRTMDCLPTAQ